MKVFHSTRHRVHDPQSWLFKGGFARAQEVPERGEILLRAATRAGHDVVEVDATEQALVARVHDAGYLAFLERAHREWAAQPGASAEVVPNVHPGRTMATRPAGIVGQAGYYQADGACPIGEGTWSAALAATGVALAAARAVTEGAGYAYALCRPPGHHAYADLAGGFCYLNNTAIAAEHCRGAGAQKVAIIDVDVHHGNGTQGIFYRRGDVLTVSLHGDPDRFYPWFAGFAEERGEGPGNGANLNVPLPRGTADEVYLGALEAALETVAAFGPDMVVVALGLDASVDDPLAFLAVSTDGFRRIGARLGELALPTVLVQEGGYVSPVLGDNLAAALAGFESTARR